MGNNNEKKGKIPGAAIAIVAVVLAVIVFVPTVYMPYKNKKPVMDEEHQAVVEEINMLDEAIANQVNIEKNIEELTEEWEQFQKDMFVDAKTSLDDVQQVVDDIGFHLINFNRGPETPDENGTVSFTGSPLYYVSLSLNGYADKDTLLEFLKFVEQDSIGCYYVKNLSASPLQEDLDMGKYTVKAGDFEVNMTIYLYYYNQKITVEVTTEEETAEE